jgi:hypothetical protein
MECQRKAIQEEKGLCLAGTYLLPPQPPKEDKTGSNEGHSDDWASNDTGVDAF